MIQLAFTLNQIVTYINILHVYKWKKQNKNKNKKLAENFLRFSFDSNGFNDRVEHLVRMNCNSAPDSSVQKCEVFISLEKNVDRLSSSS